MTASFLDPSFTPILINILAFVLGLLIGRHTR